MLECACARAISSYHTKSVGFHSVCVIICFDFSRAADTIKCISICILSILHDYPWVHFFSEGGEGLICLCKPYLVKPFTHFTWRSIVVGVTGFKLTISMCSLIR